MLPRLKPKPLVSDTQSGKETRRSKGKETRHGRNDNVLRQKPKGYFKTEITDT